MSIEIETVETAIVQALSGPKSATADGVTVTQQSASELMQMHRYLSGLAVAANPGRALGRRYRLIPDGASQGPSGWRR